MQRRSMFRNEQPTRRERPKNGYTFREKHFSSGKGLCVQRGQRRITTTVDAISSCRLGICFALRAIFTYERILRRARRANIARVTYHCNYEMQLETGRSVVHSVHIASPFYAKRHNSHRIKRRLCKTVK